MKTGSRIRFVVNCMFKKIIFTGLSPNITAHDVRTALSFLLLPWRWAMVRKGNAPEAVETRLREYYGVKHAMTCDSGRSALFLTLQALGVRDGDNVLLQGYTCIVVTNAIRQTGAMPVYVDVLSDATMDPSDLRKKITPRAKALIIQHTFGKTAQLDDLLSIAKEHHLRVVEDCAHAIGTTYNGKKVGTFGDAAMISFGSEKVISCGRGGAIITNDDTIGETILRARNELRPAPLGMVLQHLLHYPIFWIGRACYGIGVGKLILITAKALRVVHRIIYPKEKKGGRVQGIPARFPNSLACILLHQLSGIDEINTHRLRIGRLYEEKFHHPIGLSESFIPLRFPLFVKDPAGLMQAAKKQGILLGDWYNRVVAPDDTEPAATYYTPGACPMAETLARQSVNLPTDIHVTRRDIEKIIQTNMYANSRSERKVNMG